MDELFLSMCKQTFQGRPQEEQPKRDILGVDSALSRGSLASLQVSCLRDLCSLYLCSIPHAQGLSRCLWEK